MKKKTFAIVVAFLFSIQTKAQNTIQPNNVPQANILPRTNVVQQPNVSAHILNISDITLSIDSSVRVTTGAGAVKHYFKAVINYIGSGTIQYQWFLVNPVNGPNNHPSIVQGILQLSGTGTDEIFTERDRVNDVGQKRFTLKIISPTQVDSNIITF